LAHADSLLRRIGLAYADLLLRRIGLAYADLLLRRSPLEANEREGNAQNEKEY